MTMPTRKTPKELLQKLKQYVQEGDDRMDQSMACLIELEESVNKDKWETKQTTKTWLASFREGDETLLHLAAKYQTNTEFMEEIIKMCPHLLLVSRQSEYEGQLPLHIVITKQNMEAIQLFLEKRTLREKMLNVQATGSHFINTVMMGELPFSTAALTLDPDILSVMLNIDKTSYQISSRNSYGDNVFHSLVKYSCLHPEKSAKIIEVFKMINNKLKRNLSHERRLESIIDLNQKDQMGVWLQPNLAQKTPLQLAACLNGVPLEIFQFILELDGIYRYRDRHDGLFDVFQYDITEIDPVALRNFTENQKGNLGKNKVDPRKDIKDLEVNETKTRFIRFGSKNMRKSVLEASCEVNMEQALGILNLKIIMVIIHKKWKKYCWIYFIWAALHLIYMGLLTWSAIVKAEWRPSKNCTITSTTDSAIPVLPNVMSGFNMVISLIIIVLELRRKYHNKIPLQIRRLHHNGTYRLMLLVFSGSLMIDGIWHIISISTSAFPGNDYFLILALFIGFWFFMFFLRAFQKFSFFTVMLQKMLVGDAFRFAVIILLEYISFTVIMYMVFLSTCPKGFKSIGNTFLTMFNLMLGLTELSVLTQASEPWLAVLIFICFIVLTYVLMFNALIAMMSNTCNYVSQNRFIQWKLQKLSVILFLEDLLPSKRRVCCGKPKKIKRYDFQVQTMVEETRYFLEIDSLQVSAEGFDDLHQENKSRQPQFYLLETAPNESRTSDKQNNPVTLRQEPTLQPDISAVK